MQQLPGASKEETTGGARRQRSVYTPHSTRATTVTLLLDAGADIPQGLGRSRTSSANRHITTTQIYDKRRRSTSDSASHDVPI